MVHREESLDGGQQAHDLFLADFHSAADSHAGAQGSSASRDQIGPAQQQAGGLGTSQSLAAGKGDQIETLVEVLRKAARRGNVRGGVVEDRNGMILAGADPILPFDLAQRLIPVEEKEHRRARVDRLFELGGVSTHTSLAPSKSIWGS